MNPAQALESEAKTLTGGANDSRSPVLWRVADAAAFLACSESYVYKAAERGELPCIRIGAMLRFSPEEVFLFAFRDRADRQKHTNTKAG